MSATQRHAQQTLLMQTAERLGVAVDDKLDAWGCDAVVYAYSGQSRTVFLGRIEASLSHVAFQLTEDKHVAKAIIDQAGMRAPEGVLIQTNAPETAQKLIKATLGQGGDWVLKPRSGEYGLGILMNLADPDAALAHIEAEGGDGEWLLERQIHGDDVRIQAIGRQLVAASIRKPAFVTGDGVRDIETLARAHDEKVRSHNAWNRCLIDAELVSTIARQGHALDSVPAKGEDVRLKATANMSKGALAIDVTDRLHPSYAEWTRRLGDAFEIELYSVDMMCTDLSGPADAHGWVLEINAGPDWLHHTFSEGRRHDIPEQLLKFMFPALPV